MNSAIFVLHKWWRLWEFLSQRPIPAPPSAEAPQAWNKAHRNNGSVPGNWAADVLVSVQRGLKELLRLFDDTPIAQGHVSITRIPPDEVAICTTKNSWMAGWTLITTPRVAHDSVAASCSHSLSNCSIGMCALWRECHRTKVFCVQCTVKVVRFFL